MNKPVNDEVWSGAWVTERLGVELRGDDALTGLLGLALRRNPKRAHLLVSNVLGKHVPQSPAVVYGHGGALGRRVRDLLGDEEAARAVVLGYAETATGLGHSVADGLGLAPYLHSTRRPVPGVAPAGGFEEAHSHATSHLLLPEDPALLAGDGPLVLVDDEFSTGNTVLNTIRDLHERHPRGRYVVVALVDMRSPRDAARLAAFADEIGARVDLVAAASGTVLLPEGVLEKGQALVTRYESAAPGMPDGGPSHAATIGGAGATGSEARAEGADACVREPAGGGLPDGLPAGGDEAGARGAGLAGAESPAAGGAPPVTGEAVASFGTGTRAVGSAAAGRGAGPAAPPGLARQAAGARGVPSAAGEAAAFVDSGPPMAGTGEIGGCAAAGRAAAGAADRVVPEAPGLPAAPGAAVAEAPADEARTADAAGREDTHGGAGQVGSGVDAGAVERVADAGMAGADARGAGVSGPRGPRAGSRGRIARVPLPWPVGVPDGGRHGFTPVHRERLEEALPAMAARVAEALPGDARRVLVLGFEELMYAPLRLAEALERAVEGEVRYSTTTRSPVLAVDDPGYAIRSRIVFPAHDDPADGPGERYAYNVAGAGFDAVVAVVDSAADTPALHAPQGLLARLAEHAPHVLLAVVPSYAPERPPMLPEPLRGPAFSSYAPEEVGWLLQDLSDVTLEAPTEEREEAIQSGGAHYAESLPVEYQPSEQYQALFHAALEASAARIAHAVGVVTETVIAERSPRPVLVSLARAGTPVGVLMRRWAQFRHGLELPHYAVSIVRGRGIDANALRWLAAHHDPRDVVFVDGWTGKGAITRELADALAGFEASDHITGFDPEIAVLADPGSCVRTYGTREDFLIPSACLNSTVSGLISRTVLRADLVGPHDFHGAKFYRELAAVDVSVAFLDAVSARFQAVADRVDEAVKDLAAGDRTPSWEGWKAVERISEEYGIHDVNLVKPGVGETTRVLLRRVPWKILARAGAGADLDHVRLLAEQRGVPVEEVDELPYTCVGLIHPKYTRGATGADGKAVNV
ncbi:phosphoribosyltransferase [Streptomyces sp. NPDC001843]|uniref:phosphoribosyltransferase n=1 Tax=Streptomyces sp. NPDC001843 TaxID=3364617 RepID=UPI0036A75CC9